MQINGKDSCLSGIGSEFLNHTVKILAHSCHVQEIAIVLWSTSGDDVIGRV